MIQAGDIVWCHFPGAQVSKSRPSIVVCTAAYIGARPDVVLALLTTQTPRVLTAFDYWLQDWAAAGLRQRSLFRIYFAMAEQTRVNVVGQVSSRDWLEIQSRLRLAIAI